MSSGSRREVHVKCPFFMHNRQVRTIACEGVTDAEYPTKRQFRRQEDMDKHFADYCCGDYRYCEYYRMLMDYKYKD